MTEPRVLPAPTEEPLSLSDQSMNVLVCGGAGISLQQAAWWEIKKLRERVEAMEDKQATSVYRTRHEACSYALGAISPPDTPRQLVRLAADELVRQLRDEEEHDAV